MADFDRAFSRLAECPAAQINRFSTVHPRERIQDQAVPDLIEFQSWFVIDPKLLGSADQSESVVELKNVALIKQPGGCKLVLRASGLLGPEDRVR